MHIYHILYIKYILHISYFAYFAHYNSDSLYFPLAGHSDRLNIFKSAAFYALSDEELEEIVSCKNEPVLRAYAWSVPGGLPSLEVYHASGCQGSVPE